MLSFYIYLYLRRTVSANMRGICQRRPSIECILLFQLGLTAFNEKHHALCSLCTLGIAVCLNFSLGWHIMKKHRGEHFSKMEYKKSTHTPTPTQAHNNMVCRSSMTSGNTKLIDLAKLVAVFLYLNSMKPWQILEGWCWERRADPAHPSLKVTERLNSSARVSASY